MTLSNYIHCVLSVYIHSSSSSPQPPTKLLTSRFRTLAGASLAGFALGALMEFAYYKSGYCTHSNTNYCLLFCVFFLYFVDDKLQQPVKLNEIIQDSTQEQ